MEVHAPHPGKPLKPSEKKGKGRQPTDDKKKGGGGKKKKKKDSTVTLRGKHAPGKGTLQSNKLIAAKGRMKRTGRPRWSARPPEIDELPPRRKTSNTTLFPHILAEDKGKGCCPGGRPGGGKKSHNGATKRKTHPRFPTGKCWDRFLEGGGGEERRVSRW